MNMSATEQPGLLQSFTIDQLAGSAALILGSVASLLMVIWKSRCLCRCRLGISDKCFCFDCVREPPPPDEIAENSDNEEEAAKKPLPSSKQATDVENPKPEPVLVPEPEPEPAPCVWGCAG